MDEIYWDKHASDYDTEIFDVFANNKGSLLQSYIKKHSNKKHDVIDFGCGTGKCFEYLSPGFRNILAVDISGENIVHCTKRINECSYPNITLKKLDLSLPDLRLRKADFAFCCNVVMLPDIEKNLAIIRNIYKYLRHGGSALVVIPSLESQFLATYRVIEWCRKEGIKVNKIPLDNFDHLCTSKLELAQGFVKLQGVPTKHYLQAEIVSLFSSVGFEVIATEKLEYTWKTEFESPPKWMRDPYPWDWLVELKK